MPRFDPAKLRRELAIRAMTIAEVAEAADVDASTVYRALQGAGLHAKNFGKIAAAIAGRQVIPGLAEIIDQSSMQADPAVASVFIVDKGLLLLCRRRYREGSLEWAAISTEIEPNEQTAAAVARAARERVGLDVEVTTELGERLHPATGRHLLYFGARVVGGQASVVARDSITEIEWCDLETVKARLGATSGGIYPPVLEYLEREMAT